MQHQKDVITTSIESVGIATSSTDISRYDRSCRVALKGDDLALLAYAFLALRPDLSRSEQATCLREIRDAAKKEKQFRLTSGSQKPRIPRSSATIIAKPQASNWAMASPVRAVFPPPSLGMWNYRVVNFSIASDSSKSPQWNGNLIVVYECTSGLFFHHFTREYGATTLSKEHVIYVLALADETVRELNPGGYSGVQQRKVVFPDIRYDGTCAKLLQAAKVYSEVCDFINSPSQKHWAHNAKWMSRRRIAVDLRHWHASTCPQTCTPFTLQQHFTPTSVGDTADVESTHHKIRFPTARPFGNALRRMTGKIKNWYPLNPRRSATGTSASSRA